MYGGYLLLSQLPSSPGVEEQVPTPAGFAKCSVNSHNLKQLVALKEFADVCEHFKTTIAKHRTTFEKADFQTTLGAACTFYFCLPFVSCPVWVVVCPVQVVFLFIILSNCAQVTSKRSCSGRWKAAALSLRNRNSKPLLSTAALPIDL